MPFTDQSCRICGNRMKNRLYRVPEMMFGTREAFDYFECARCDCLQISRIPSDMAPHYPRNYYSLQPPPVPSSDTLGTRVARYLRARRTLYFMYRRNRIGQLLHAVKPVEAKSGEYLGWLLECRADLDSRILDVGSGCGTVLLELSRCGFKCLDGIDPYLAEDSPPPPGVRIRKMVLVDMAGRYDVIMFNHSLEHMPDQVATLRHASTLLAACGSILVRIPTVSSHAWRRYREHWVQLDAPRHFYLHSRTSITLLAEAAGLTIRKTVCDSTAFQFWGSEQYARGIPLTDGRSLLVNRHSGLFSQADLLSFEHSANRLNAQHDGDQVCIYMEPLKGNGAGRDPSSA